MWTAAWKCFGAGVLAFCGAGAALALETAASGPGWSQFQGRLSLGTASPSLRVDAPGFDTSSLKLSSLSLMADYYLIGTPAQAGLGGGLRATSGVLFGSRSAPWSSPGGGGAFSVDRRSLGAPADPAGDAGTVPYLGIGYTGLSVKGGWGFSADLGVTAGRFGRNLGQSLDDQVRELRLAPVLQLGVSYSF